MRSPNIEPLGRGETLQHARRRVQTQRLVDNAIEEGERVQILIGDGFSRLQKGLDLGSQLGDPVRELCQLVESAYECGGRCVATYRSMPRTSVKWMGKRRMNLPATMIS